jgi:hypothetical protein
MLKGTLAIVGLILVVVLVVLTHSIYFSSNIDKDGNTLDCLSTIKNALGIYRDNSLGVSSVLEKGKELKTMVKSSISDLTSRKKEVFNIENNEYTYEQAPSICSAFGAELATYDQLQKAHKQGANWCNYGWSANQMALYPIQKDYYNSLQIGPKELRDSCGKPGINGGFFSDKSIQLGVNCYGYKPKPDQSRIVYIENEANPLDKSISSGTVPAKTANQKNTLDKANIDILPFSNDKWSTYSYKKSSYIIKPKTDKNTIVQDKYLEITQPITDIDKDPRKLTITDNTINNELDSGEYL